MSKHGNFHWNELMTRDPEGAKKFYADSVGWSFDAMPMGEGTYWVCMQDKAPVGGIMDMNGPDFEGIPPHWFSYLEVDDIDARLAKVSAAGGEVMRPAFDVEKVGRIAIVKDPTGAALGLITPAREG